jgi:hypothetical protein
MRRTYAAVASPLLQTVAIGVLGMLRPICAPVIVMAIGPDPSRLNLISPVVGVSPQLVLLPASPALTLTGRQGAITLMWNLRTRPEYLVA